MKDPAFLFYPGDWLGGTVSFSRSHKGAYMDLLVAQFNQGPMSIDDIRDILGSDFELMWDRKLKAKFKQDESGNFYNERLKTEQDKRSNFSKSRRKNLSSNTDHKGDHTATRMENENENTNESKNTDVSVTVYADFDFDFVHVEFAPAFLEWLDYKKGKGQKYKTQKSLEACYSNLLTLSNNNPETAMAIVKQSMGQNYAGLFPLKNGTNNTNINDRKESVTNLKELSRKVLTNLSGQNGN